MTAQVGLGGGGSDGMRMPGLKVMNPVLNVRVSFSGDDLEIAWHTNPVSALKGITTKRFIDGIAACRVGGVVSRVHGIAEDEPGGKRPRQASHHSRAE